MRHVAILALLLATALAAGRPPAPAEPAPGDPMIEEYLRQETKKLSERFLDGARTRKEWQGKLPRLKQEYLERTEEFFARYGAMAVFLSRFMPIIRTFAPFVAGVGRMSWARFLAYNLAGGVCWVLLFISVGYWFGNLPIVKNNFGLVTIGIILISLLPILGVIAKRRVTGAGAMPRESARPRAG